MTVDLAALFGSDINCLGGFDLDPYFDLVEGAECLGQALLRRLLVVRGGLLDDPSYGFDVRAYLNDSAPNLASVEGGVVEQLEADERVERATATATFNDVTGVLRITATAFTGAGPFRLVLDVSALTVALLTVEAL